MLTAKEIRELIQGKLDDITALMKLAEADDNRELTEKEQAVIDGLLAEIGTRAVDGKPATGMYHDYDQAERYESIRDDLGSHRTEPVAPAVGGDGLIEPVHYAHARLKAYETNLEAYNAGQFFAATLFGNAKADQYCRDNGIYGAQSGSDNSRGGVLVPIQTETAIINLREERGVFRREARQVPMASDTQIVPRRASGLTAYFVTDGASITASDKTWDEVSLVAKKLAALVYYSSELNEDSVVSIGDDLTAEIAYAFADKEDECGFNGTGTSTYGGIVGVLQAMAAGGTYDAATGNTAFSTLDLADFEGIIGQLPQYAVANAKWYISRVGYYQSMARLANAGGGNTTENVAGGPNVTMFMGFPVVFAQVLNAVTAAQASTNVLAFGDLAMAATLGSRRGVSVMISEEARFVNDQLAIRGIERFDINVHEKAGAVQVMKTPSS